MLGERLVLGVGQFLYRRRLNWSLTCLAQTVVRVRSPRGVLMYPTTPTANMGGASRMVTASTTSFLWALDPGRSISRSTWVMPAL